VPKFVADSVETTGLKWVAPAGGGKVLQVVSATTTTATTITSTSLTDTGITATITPTSATSTILIFISYSIAVNRSGNDQYSAARLLRGGTNIGDWGTDEFFGIGATGATFVFLSGQASVIKQDSPATTSATTYKLQSRVESAGSVFAQYGGSPSTIILMEIGA
jgi:hypothetical protein